MSLQAIRNGLVTTLAACGPWAASEISTCSFDVLEHASACAVVILPGPTSEIDPDRLGSANRRNYLRRWNMTGTLYIRDTGDPVAVLSRTWQGHDDLFNTISKDDSLNGSACAARLLRINGMPGQFVEAGGHLWKPVEFIVEAEEF